MKQKKIVSKDGSYIFVEPNGRVWVSQDEKSFTSPGYVKDKICNVHKLLGIDKKYDKYFGVELKIVKHAKRLGISGLRALRTYVEDGKYGQTLKVKYGWVYRKEFEYLLKHRKVVSCVNQKALLLKSKDFSWQEV